MRYRTAFTKAVLLTLLLCAAGQFSRAHAPGRFYLSLSLTRGERSRDSHSSTTVITVDGGRLVYDKTFSGYRRLGSQPIHKQFELSPAETEKLRQAARSNGLLKSGTLAFSTEEKGLYTYFDLTIKLTDGKRQSLIKLSGPRRSEKIKEAQLYKNAEALLQEVFNLARQHDEEIALEGLADN